MRSVDQVDKPAEDQPEAAGSPRPSRRATWAVWLSYPALSVLVFVQLWISPNTRVLSHNEDDHGQFLFWLAHGERVLFHGDNPFWSDRLNAPDGINMMANTSILALSLPLAPVTWLFGPGVSVALLLTLGLAGTAAAWYFVFHHRMGLSRFAAWTGGLWCGFCPAMVSHGSGHVNFVSQFLVPFIVWQVLRLREPGQAVRGGIRLALLIVVQIFINEEVLLFTALTLGVFVLAYATMRRSVVREVWRRYAAGLGVAAGASFAVLAAPLWLQFFGRGSYHGQPFDPGWYVTDLLQLGAYARQSLAGTTALAEAVSVSATEDNTFFGLPMLILLAAGLKLLWRSAAARATAVAGLVLLIASFGPRLRIAGWDSPIPLPFGLISDLPVLDLVSVTRFAMVTATIVGILLALIVDRGVRLPGRARVVFLAALAVAVVPVLPKPLPVTQERPLPPFVADGMWREYVTGDRTLVPVPLPEVTTGREGMRWAGLSHLAFPMPRGYFMGPVNAPADDTGSWRAPERPTSALFKAVRQNGFAPAITSGQRAAAMADLTYWRAGVVVLIPGTRHEDALGATVTALLGRQPQRVGGVLLWDVRDLPVPPRG